MFSIAQIKLFLPSNFTFFNSKIKGIFFIKKLAIYDDFWYIKFCQFAGMAELADAHGSGPCEGYFMEVRVLLPAPNKHDSFDTIGVEAAVLFHFAKMPVEQEILALFAVFLGSYH